jgi:hypothetical protein
MLLQHSLLFCFEPFIYHAPRQFESAQRTIDNSPAIYRWDQVAIQTTKPVKRATEATEPGAIATGCQAQHEWSHPLATARGSVFSRPHVIDLTGGVIHYYDRSYQR